MMSLPIILLPIASRPHLTTSLPQTAAPPSRAPPSHIDLRLGLVATTHKTGQVSPTKRTRKYWKRRRERNRV